jgi:hypothetical protein
MDRETPIVMESSLPEVDLGLNPSLRTQLHAHFGAIGGLLFILIPQLKNSKPRSAQRLNGVWGSPKSAII